MDERNSARVVAPARGLRGFHLGITLDRGEPYALEQVEQLGFEVDSRWRHIVGAAMAVAQQETVVREARLQPRTAWNRHTIVRPLRIGAGGTVWFALEYLVDEWWLSAALVEEHEADLEEVGTPARP